MTVRWRSGSACRLSEQSILAMPLTSHPPGDPVKFPLPGRPPLPVSPLDLPDLIQRPTVLGPLLGRQFPPVLHRPDPLRADQGRGLTPRPLGADGWGRPS